MAENKEQTIEALQKAEVHPHSSKKKLIFYCIFFICLVSLVVVLSFNLGDLSKMAETFLAVWEGDHLPWLILALVCGLVYFVAYPTPLMIVSKRLGMKAGMGDVWTIGASEHFYNGVTPSNAGGQPFQIYALTSCGLDAASASGTILLNYINICLCSNIWGLASLIYYPSYVSNLSDVGGADLTGLGVIALLGIILNLLNLLFFVFLGVSKKFRHGFMRFFYWTCKWKWLGKRLSKFGPKLDEYLKNSQVTFKDVRNHFPSFAVSVLVRMAFLFVLYSANFFLLKAVGCEVTYADFPKILLATAFATVCVSWFPTPGAVGAGELVGSIVIASVGHIPSSSGTAVSLLWRMLSFYAVLALSLVVSILFETRLSRRMKSLNTSAPKIENSSLDKTEN